MKFLWLCPAACFVIAALLAVFTTGPMGDTWTGAFTGYGIATTFIVLHGEWRLARIERKKHLP
jgi:hypothetical protein